MIYNVILESGDLGGKTSVMQELEKLLGRTLTRHSIPIKDLKHFSAQIGIDYAQWDLCNRAHMPYIMDRWHGFSNIVYSDPRQTTMLQSTTQQIQALGTLCKAPVIIILLLEKEETIRERYAVRGDEYLGIESILEMHQKYADVAEQLEKSNVPIDMLILEQPSNLGSAEETAKVIYEYLKGRDNNDKKRISRKTC